MNKSETARLPVRDFTRSLPMELLSAREQLMRQFRPLLREFDLTEQQWRVLRVLAESEGIEARDLAARSLILSPSLSRILQRLAERGLIKRRAAPNDQRRAIISMSTRGMTVFNAVAPRVESHYAHIAQRMGDARLEQLYSLLAELQTALTTAG